MYNDPYLCVWFSLSSSGSWKIDTNTTQATAGPLDCLVLLCNCYQVHEKLQSSAAVFVYQQRSEQLVEMQSILFFLEKGV